LSATTVLGTNTVNEFHVGYLRNSNIIGQPKGGLGVSLASQGFVTGANTPGIVVQIPQFEGIQNIAFPGFTLGVPITNETQVNNTYNVSEGLSRGFGTHTLKVGGQFHFDQVNEHPNGIFNGTFNIDGTETGDPFADFLIGVPSSFQQSSGRPFYLRNRYFARLRLLFAMLFPEAIDVHWRLAQFFRRRPIAKIASGFGVLLHVLAKVSCMGVGVTAVIRGGNRIDVPVSDGFVLVGSFEGTLHRVTVFFLLLILLLTLWNGHVPDSFRLCRYFLSAV
jgi:hypothetical protein